MPDTDAALLQSLLALQDEDVHARQLRHRLGRLPEAVVLAETEGRLARLDAAIAEASAQQEEAAGRRDALEVEAEQIGARIARIEAQANLGGAGFRDQQAMASEVESLRTRRRHVEDEELGAMEAIEPLEAELGRLEHERSELVAAAAAARAELDRAAAAIDEELAAVTARRSALARAIAPPVLAEYERLAARLDGVAVARLVHGMCDGCRLQLPATEIDHIRHAPPGEVFHCDQCGRILVPSTPASPAASDGRAELT